MIAILITAFLFLIYAPQWWVKYIMNKYDKPITQLPGNGSELAQHLIDRYQLNVSVEKTDVGDHYDPKTRTVRLSPKNYDGKSLTAVAVAAHEVGHAVQDHRKEGLLIVRGKMVETAQRFEKIGAGIIIIAPLIGALTRVPAIGLLLGIIGIFSMASTVVVQLISLPVEFDASFNKALPLLEEGNYVSKQELVSVRKVLLAAALTYVAAALSGLFNVWRWIKILKR